VKGRIRLVWPLALAALVFVGTTAETCSSPVGALATIKYEQVGGCQGAGHTFAGTGAAFIVFRIDSIDNTASGSRDFDFDPNKLYLGSDPRADVKTTYGVSLGNPFVTYGQLVAAGSRASSIGDVFAIVAGPTISGNRIEKFTLYYATPAGTEGVLLSDQGHDTTFPYSGDCQSLQY
jgi:hypothetical protein